MYRYVPRLPTQSSGFAGELSTLSLATFECFQRTICRSRSSATQHSRSGCAALGWVTCRDDYDVVDDEKKDDHDKNDEDRRTGQRPQIHCKKFAYCTQTQCGPEGCFLANTRHAFRSLGPPLDIRACLCNRWEAYQYMEVARLQLTSRMKGSCGKGDSSTACRCWHILRAAFGVSE